jgi:hypothetical protein
MYYFRGDNLYHATLAALIANFAVTSFYLVYELLMPAKEEKNRALRRQERKMLTKTRRPAQTH